MPRFRRVTALLLSFLLAHVMWVGSGFACVMPAMEMGSATSAAPAMEMSDADMRAMGMLPAAPKESGPPASDEHADCDLPWAPAGCQSAAPCTPVANVAGGQLLGLNDQPSPGVASIVELIPPSAVRLPELPPPRS